MKKKTPKAIYGSINTSIKISDTAIHCYVLDNGLRIVSQKSLFAFLEIRNQTALNALHTNNVINKDLLDIFSSPIEFNNDSSKVDVLGYEAKHVQEFVRTISKAYLKKEIPASQILTGQNAEQLDDLISKVGLIPLIDEITGYKPKEKGELQKLIKKPVYKEDDLSDFNKLLKTALNYNPKKDKKK